MMDHWERVHAAAGGKPVDRMPVSLWRHWPIDDQEALDLAEVTVRWQESYDWDLVKVPLSNSYGVEDWGARTKYVPNDLGVRTIYEPGLTSADQWPELPQLDVCEGHYGTQIAAVRLIAQRLRGRVPIFQTLFSPLATARKLAGDRMLSHLRRNPEELKAGLKIIAETTIRFAEESLRAGADCLFYAMQNESYRVLTEAEYREFGEPYDRMVLDALRPSTELIMLHAHGEDIMFDLVAAYPCDAINWHDRITWPDLRTAGDRFSGLRVGGVSELATLAKGPVQQIEAEVHDAIEQCEGRRLLVGPGCIIPINLPVSHLRAVRSAVENWR